MFRASNAHLQEDSCTHAAYGTVTLYESSWWPVGTQLEWELKFCVKMYAGLQAGTHLLTERTYTHQMLCCRITTLTFTFLTNFKIS